MKITDVNLPDDLTTPMGLKPIAMHKIGGTVLLAGKNGAGKTRILNLVRNNASNIFDFRSKKASAEPQISKNKANIQAWKLNISMEPQNVENVKRLQNAINSAEEAIRNYEAIQSQADPVITDISDMPVVVVDFVPKTIDLQDWANANKQEWMNRAIKAKNIGVQQLHSSCLPLIQQVMERWVNTSHPNLDFSEQEKKAALDDYCRLQEIVEKFLRTKIGWDKDGYSTLFGMPIAKAQLSAGQSVILQLCIAIFAQGGTLSNHVIFMDEPENHLHPSAVIDLLDAIKEQNPNGQIWIATHSIPLLSHFDESSIWYVDEGSVSYAGRKPELVLNGLLGNEERIHKLRDFAGLPAELARNRFAFECLQPPTVVLSDSRDPQIKQLHQQLKIIWEDKVAINFLDFGAGKGRLISYLNEYEGVSSSSLNYYAFDSSPQYRDICIRNISTIYDEGESRYHSSIESLRTKLDDHFFDVVVLSNVLHEIEHRKWCSVFQSIMSLLRDDGYLLIIEDCRLPVGELPHQNGFLVLNTLHLKKLFGIPSDETRFIAHDARFDSVEDRGRLMAHLIPKKYLNQATIETIKSAVIEVKSTALTEIATIRSQASSYSRGLAHAFWVQQLANATLILSEM